MCDAADSSNAIRKGKLELRKFMEKDLEQRTKRFALAVLEFASNLPPNRTADVLVRQLLRSATSMGANYREANRGVSRADFTNKIGTVQKEAAESQYWIELLTESGIANAESVETCTRNRQNFWRFSPQSGKRLKK